MVLFSQLFAATFVDKTGKGEDATKGLRVIQMKLLDIMNLMEDVASKSDPMTKEILLNLADSQSKVSAEIQSLMEITLPALKVEKRKTDRWAEQKVEEIKRKESEKRKKKEQKTNKKGLNLEKPKKEEKDKGGDGDKKEDKAPPKKEKVPEPKTKTPPPPPPPPKKDDKAPPKDSGGGNKKAPPPPPPPPKKNSPNVLKDK